MSLGSKSPEFQQYQPPDTVGLRSQQLGLLQSLLGLNGGGMSPAPLTGGSFDKKVKQAGRTSLGIGAPQTGAGMPDLEAFFGALGLQPTALQRQATGGISQYLNQPAPEQRALDVSMPALQGILNGKPGAGIMDALQPMFDRNLSAANQQGGRFGSANAIMRSRAIEDHNLLGARAAETGINQQMQAAQVLQMLSGAAGQAPFNRLTAAAGVGQADAQQADLETQRRIGLLMSLLGSAQGLAFNQPIIQTQQGGGGLLGGMLGLGLGSFLGPIGGAAGAKVGEKVFGGGK